MGLKAIANCLRAIRWPWQLRDLWRAMACMESASLRAWLSDLKSDQPYPHTPHRH